MYVQSTLSITATIGPAISGACRQVDFHIMPSPGIIKRWCLYTVGDKSRFDCICITFIHSVFMNITAQEQIRSTFARAQLGQVSVIQSPDAVYAAASSAGYSDSTNNAWIALVAIAAIIILCCIVGMIVICFSHAR